MNPICMTGIKLKAQHILLILIGLFLSGIGLMALLKDLLGSSDIEMFAIIYTVLMGIVMIFGLYRLWVSMTGDDYNILQRVAAITLLAAVGGCSLIIAWAIFNIFGGGYFD